MTRWRPALTRWRRRASAWQRRAAPRRARSEVERLVLQSDGHAFRAAHVRRRDGEIEVLALEHGERERCLAFLGACAAPERDARAVLVTHEARPSLVQLPDRADGGAVPPLLVAHAELPLRRAWAERFAAHGLALDAVYPLASGALGLLDADTTTLCVQVEHGLVVVMEVVRGRCVELVLHSGAADARVLRGAIGAGCPEVLLAGGGADLSELGYALARDGATWVRILRPRAPGAAVPELSAMMGAARHALGIAPLSRLGCAAVPRGPGLRRTLLGDAEER